MYRVRTHYDNLKVSRDAPREVIRAAYRTLAAKYHPDVHLGNDNAARIMRIINTSYEVLSDPERRLNHDEWIRRMEAGDSATITDPPPRPPDQAVPKFATDLAAIPAPPLFRRVYSAATSIPLTGWAILAAAACTIILSVIQGDSGPQPQRIVVPVPVPAPTTEPPAVKTTREGVAVPRELQPMEPAREPERPIYTVIPEIQVGRPGYIRWQLTPNGYPWPDKSGYLFGYEQGSMGGRSNLKIDCTEYASDVLVKVYDHRFSPPKAVRTIFIKSYDQFMVAKLVAGEYDVRYQDLASWSISESDTIAFSERTSETPLPNGDVEIKHFWHDQRITLYRVFNPENPINFQPITEDQFQ